MLQVIAVVISGISLFIVIINQFKMIKDKEPQLSFNLRSMDQILYLRVKNSGMTKARNIRIIINKIYNNGNNGVEEDQIFQIPFELSSQEEVQGMIGILSNNKSKIQVPYIDIEVSYYKTYFVRKVEYKRQVFYFASAEEKIRVEFDNNKAK